MDARIEYRECGSDPWDLWAIRVGTREEIIWSAEDLLRDLRYEFPTSKVRIILQNNHVINARYKKNLKPLKKDEDEILPEEE